MAQSETTIEFKPDAECQALIAKAINDLNRAGAGKAPQAVVTDLIQYAVKSALTINFAERTAELDILRFREALGLE